MQSFIVMHFDVSTALPEVEISESSFGQIEPSASTRQRSDASLMSVVCFISWSVSLLSRLIGCDGVCIPHIMRTVSVKSTRWPSVGGVLVTSLFSSRKSKWPFVDAVSKRHAMFICGQPSATGNLANRRYELPPSASCWWTRIWHFNSQARARSSKLPADSPVFFMRSILSFNDEYCWPTSRSSSSGADDCSGSNSLTCVLMRFTVRWRNSWATRVSSSAALWSFSIPMLLRLPEYSWLWQCIAAHRKRHWPSPCTGINS